MRSSEEELALADTEEHSPPALDPVSLSSSLDDPQTRDHHPSSLHNQTPHDVFDLDIDTSEDVPWDHHESIHTSPPDDDLPTLEETAPAAFRTKPSAQRKWLKRIVLSSLGLGMLLLIAVAALFWHQGRDLPPLESLAMYRPWRITRVMDVNQQVVMTLATQRRRVVPYQKLPPHLIHAIVAAEDGDFFRHYGFDYLGILRAFWKNLWRRKGAPKQGGSTITQQVVKTFLLSREQTYTRKIKEAILSWRLERHLRKWEILYLYLNQIDFGRGNYGVEEASQYYFGKSVVKLTINESAILASIPKNPERYNPANSIPLTTRRRNYVLRMMRRLQFIDQPTYERVRNSPVLPPPPTHRPAFQRDYYTEAVRQEALQRLATYLQRKRGYKPGKKLRQTARQMLYRGGLRIDTALDPRAQRLAIQSLRRGLRKIDRRQGYRGPIQHLARHQWAAFRKQPHTPNPYHKALVIGQDSKGYILSFAKHQGRLPWAGMAWLKHSHNKDGTPGKRLYHLLQPGDVLWVSPLPPTKDANHSQALPQYQLEQIPKVQGALMVIDPRGHQVRALVGGWDIDTHPFNRALLARRQPGSAFKPIVFAAAIASRQYTAASLLQDSPLSIKVDGKSWRPTNNSKTFSNKMMRLREALANSVNTVAVRLFSGIGPYRTIAMARRLGIRSRLTLKPSLALGASAVQPLALTNAYATLAARGAHDRPVMLTRILSHNGESIYERLPTIRRTVSPGVAHIVTSMLQDTVKSGTATAARSLKRPIAGKTGTTNQVRNAWFIGYTPTTCVGVWVGHDDRKPLGPREGGSRTALPIFIDWMKEYHKQPNGKPLPPKPFQEPDGLIFVDIDPDTGYLAPPQLAYPLREAFLPGTQPTQYAHDNGPVANPNNFYKSQD